MRRNERAGGETARGQGAARVESKPSYPEHAAIPVINALSELEHPCQALADYFVLQERYGNLKNITLAYVGDGNNVLHSLLITGALLGSHVRAATPRGYEPNPEIFAAAEEIARETGARLELFTDPKKAVADVNAVYTDAWASMTDQAIDKTKQMGSDAADATKKAADATVEGTKKAASATADFTKDAAQKTADTTKKAYDATKKAASDTSKAVTDKK